MISLIAALAENAVIGRDNALPWRIPADLARFKSLTLGKPVIMGRKTYESIGRPLPKRLNIVLSRQPAALPEAVMAVENLDAALAEARASTCGKDGEVMVIGGAEIYRLFLPLARRLYLTLIHRAVAGDACFPPFDEAEWREVSRERYRGPDLDYSFINLERLPA